jgi:hypothetical protein
MYLKSLYPDVPTIPDRNVHHLFFHRPDQATWKDFTLHIDAKTGKRRMFREFVHRVQLGMTALGAPVAQGGLGLGTREDNEMIGIISQNSMVCFSWQIVTFPLDLILPVRTISHSFNLFLVSRHHLSPYLHILRRSSLSMRSNCPSARVCSLILNFCLWCFQLRRKWVYHRARYTSLVEK